MGAGIRDSRNQRGGAFTLVEILIVVAIIALLASVMVGVGRQVRKNAKIRATQSIMQMLCTALEEYNDDKGGFPPEIKDIENDFPGTDVGRHNDMTWPDTDDPTDLIAALASVEVMYWYLSEAPGSRKIIDRLPDSYVVNEDNDSVEVAGRAKPLIEVNDAWGRPLKYENQGGGNFPLLRSAGPDGELETADDIISREL